MHRPALLLCLSLGLFAGCMPDAGPPATVRGQVRVGGQALAGGSIVFAPDPDRGTQGGIATARIQRDGTFQLQTDKGLGIAPGWYRVSILADPASGVTLPDHLRDPQRSGLEREVKPDQDNVIDFDL